MSGVKRNLQYHINWATGVVELSKKFNLESNIPGNEAYEIIKDFRQQGMKIVVRDTGKRKAKKYESDEERPFGRPTYKQMKIHIGASDDAEMRLSEFEAVRASSKAHANAYQYVLNWFKETYPTYHLVPQFNDDLKVVNRPE